MIGSKAGLCSCGRKRGGTILGYYIGTRMEFPTLQYPGIPIGVFDSGTRGRVKKNELF